MASFCSCSCSCSFSLISPARSHEEPPHHRSVAATNIDHRRLLPLSLTRRRSLPLLSLQRKSPSPLLRDLRGARPRLPQLVVRSKFPFGGGEEEEEEEDTEKAGDPEKKDITNSNPNFFVKWSVPWDGQTVLVTMTSFGISFLITGLGISLLYARLGFKQRQLEFDEQSLLVFLNQLMETIIGTAVVNSCIKSYKPLPPELFYYDWKNPFDINRGWLLWGIVGIFSGAAAVLLAGTLVTYINGAPLPREGQDALLQLLPLIGSSGTSTALLFAVTGVLAPYLEETVFRGFLMTSLTKWMPIPAAVTLSAGAFALAHFTPGEIPQLFALGVVLGFSYAKSGNLLTPMIVHGLWNSGVLLLLTFLRLQGYDIREMI